MADEMNCDPPPTSRKRKATCYTPVYRETRSGSKKAKLEKADEEQWISRDIEKFFGMKSDPSRRRKKIQFPRKVNFCELPSPVIEKILSFISVDDMENLAEVNVFLNTLICGEHKTSADIPFKDEDVKKMREEKIIEKKPLLKLRCKSSHRVEVMMGSFLNYDYVLDLQVSLLDFSKLRELDLVPSSGRDSSDDQVRCHVEFSEKILQIISKNGTLGSIEKFDIMVDERGEPVFGFVSQMTKLRDFGLYILTKNNLKKLAYDTQYVTMLEKAVSSSKAHFLRLNVIRETEKKIGLKQLKSDHIRRIQFTGPCSFNGALLMPHLEVVEINCGKEYPGCENHDPNVCIFTAPNAVSGHNTIHASGKCGLMAASIYQNCPKIKEFAGVSLEGIDPEQDFKKWNIKVKKRFYTEYARSRAFPYIIELKDWARINWFTTRYPSLKK